jgi:hypothetical protein
MRIGDVTQDLRQLDGSELASSAASVRVRGQPHRLAHLLTSSAPGTTERLEQSFADR